MPSKSISPTGCLSSEDAALFYKLWMGLLDYVNRKHKIEPSLGRLITPAGLDIKKLLPIREKIWGNVGIIDEYTAYEKKTLSADEMAILKGWKNMVRGDFIVMKHLKKHSIFMTNDSSPLIYGVVGIMSTWEEMVPKDILPTTVQCVLLPFKEVILYDGIIKGGNVRFGPSYSKSFNDAYRASKALYGIITTFENLDDVLAKYDAGTKRRKHILDDILVDTYDEDAQISAWHDYFEDKLSFPFEAVCEKQLICSPLLPGEKLTVTGLVKFADSGENIVIMIEWQNRKFAIPLEQISTVDTSAVFSEAIEDWKYWVAAGYFC